MIMRALLDGRIDMDPCVFLSIFLDYHTDIAFPEFTVEERCAYRLACTKWGHLSNRVSDYVGVGLYPEHTIRVIEDGKPIYKLAYRGGPEELKHYQRTYMAALLAYRNRRIVYARPLNMNACTVLEYIALSYLAYNPHRVTLYIQSEWEGSFSLGGMNRVGYLTFPPEYDRKEFKSEDCVLFMHGDGRMNKSDAFLSIYDFACGRTPAENLPDILPDRVIDKVRECICMVPRCMCQYVHSTEASKLVGPANQEIVSALIRGKHGGLGEYHKIYWDKTPTTSLRSKSWYTPDLGLEVEDEDISEAG